MKRLTLCLGVIALATFVWAADPPAASPAKDTKDAKDPVKIAPEYSKVLVDNEHVRVVEANLPPKATLPMHSHPAYVVYVLTDAKVRFTDPAGKTTDMDLKNGQSMWREAESHAVENIGTTDCRVVHVEMKSMGGREGMAGTGAAARPAGAMMHKEHITVPAADIKWGAAPPGLPAGGQLAVISGDPAAPGEFVVRLKVPAGYRIMPHTHPTDENVTVISGTMFLGSGEKFDEATAKELPAGSYTSMPAGMKHYAFSKGESIVQIHGPGPFEINYLNPADDPRNAAKRD